MKQRYIKRPYDDAKSIEYLVGKGFSQSLAEILLTRGVTERNFDDFMGEKCVFHNPLEMPNMSEAVETINYVIESGGSILIYGDYDADGLTASSILSLFFSDNGIDNDVIIPTRDEGYGLHTENVVKAFENKYYDLVITVDCGISNAAEVEQIVSELGVEVIVTDHHELPDILPNCICINPKMGYPFPYLAGAGVAWKLVEAIAGRETALKYSDLACIGTIGDIMPMVDENRSIVKAGLANWKHRGLIKLAESSGCSSTLTCYDVAMRISPKINAAGRVGVPRVALDMLLSRDKTELAKVNKLLELNETRKQMLDEIVAESDEMCDPQVIRNERMVFLFSDTWQHGLLGIVAARYKEKYKVPAIIMTLDGDNYVGSARGIDTLDLFDVFSHCKDKLVKFGGHKASVGFSVCKDELNELRKSLADIFNSLESNAFEKFFYYDVELGQECDANEILAVTQKLQPLLPQDKIVCRVRDTVTFANSFGKEDAHLSATLSSGLEIKGFYKGQYAPYIKRGANVDILCSLEVDSYTKKICGIIEDITLTNSVCFDEFYRLNLLKNFISDGVNYCDESEARKILQQDSTIVVFDDYETYLNYCEKFDLSDYYVDIFFDSSVSSRTVVVSPLEGYDFGKYENIICFSKKNFLRQMPPRAKFVEVQVANESLYKLELTRDNCLKVYSALKNKSKYDSIKGVYDKYLSGKLNYDQFMVALRVFEELKLMKVQDKYTVDFDTSSKKDLSNSLIFCAFQN